jgi:hypothetical protein
VSIPQYCREENVCKLSFSKNLAMVISCQDMCRRSFLSCTFNLKHIMLQIVVNELNYVLDQSRRHQSAADSLDSSLTSTAFVTRMFCPFHVQFCIVAYPSLIKSFFYLLFTFFSSNGKIKQVHRPTLPVASFLCQPF